MYDYNNKDKTLEEGLSDWYFTFNWNRDRTHTHRESKVTQILRSIWLKFKPTHSYKGTSKYHN